MDKSLDKAQKANIEKFGQLPLFPEGVFQTDVNFLYNPLGILDKKAKAKLSSYTYSKVVYDKQGRECVRTWKISRNAEMDLPGPFEIDILMAIFELVYLHQAKFGTIAGPIKITTRDIIKIIGRSSKGELYRKVKRALRTWARTNIEASTTFYKDVKGQVRQRSKGLDMPVFRMAFDEDLEDQDVITDPENDNVYYIILNEIFTIGFKSYYIKPVSGYFYFNALSNPAAKRLYQILDIPFSFQQTTEIDLGDLVGRMGLQTRSVKKQKEIITKAANELKKKHYLNGIMKGEGEKPVVFERTGNDKWKAMFQIVDGVREELYKKGGPRGQLALSVSGLVQELVDRGVSDNMAVNIVPNYPESQIKKAIRHHDYLLSIKSQKIVKNPPGFLISAVINDYALPKDMEKTLEHMAKDKERAKAIKKAQEREQQEKEYEVWKKQQIKDTVGATRLEELIEGERKIVIAENKWLQPESHIATAIARSKVFERLENELNLPSFISWKRKRAPISPKN